MVGGIEMSVEVDIQDWQMYRFQSSSKGNQPKFYKDGFWCKMDNYGNHEGLAEELVSEFLKCVMNINFVEYKSVLLTYKDINSVEKAKGCISRNMYNNSEYSFVSLRSICRMAGISQSIVMQNSNITTNIVNTVNAIKAITGVETGTYFAQLAFLDSIILNEDRHTMNVGVCYNNRTKTYCVAPIFDNGSSLFCTGWTYRSNKTLQENIDRCLMTGRPFSKFHEKQVEAFLSLGFCPLLISKAMVSSLLNTYSNDLYDEKYVRRALDVLSLRLHQECGRAFVFVE